MPSTEDLIRVSERAGMGAVRAGTPADAVDGTLPRLVAAPETAEQVAAALAWATRERLATVLRGGGTKLGWGRASAAVDLVIGTAALNRVVAHRHGDLTTTIQAGAALADVRVQLAAERQWLPLDSAFEQATIGGVVATNDAGPLRHHYGTPRDLLIGVTLALTDGRVVKAGGHVVKNVAGYDLGKLVSGSYGTLAAIVDATFKLSPIPAASTTLVARYGDGAALARDVVALASSQLEPTTFEVHGAVRRQPGPASREYFLYVRFATSPAAVAAQVAGARALIAGTAGTIGSREEASLWKGLVTEPWAERGALVRLSWLPASLEAVLALVEELQSATGAGALAFTGRAAVGAGMLRIDADEAAQAVAIERLRARNDIVGNVVLLRGSHTLKARVGVWGTVNEMSGVVRALKQTFDPAGILNAGRGPI